MGLPRLDLAGPWLDQAKKQQLLQRKHGHPEQRRNQRAIAFADRRSQPSQGHGRSCRTTPVCIFLLIQLSAPTGSGGWCIVFPDESAAASLRSAEFGHRCFEVLVRSLPAPPKSFENRGL